MEHLQLHSTAAATFYIYILSLGASWNIYSYILHLQLQLHYTSTATFYIYILHLHLHSRCKYLSDGVCKVSAPEGLKG